MTKPKAALTVDTTLLPRGELSAYASIGLCDVAPENPRFGSKLEDIDELAANIAARGQLVPMIAYKDEGRYWITAGARRLEALRQQDDSPKAWLRILPRAEAIDAGLAEQIAHRGMHAAEEALAFRDQIKPGAGGDVDGQAITRVANAFGKTERYVRQRLKLAGLHPPILKALQTDKISIEQAAAWANADVELQEEIWAGAKARRNGAAGLDLYAIQAAIEKAGVAETDRLVKFVGAKQLAAEGVTVARDLFTFDDDDKLNDKAKAEGRYDAEAVKTAARKALDAECAKLKQAGWGWADGTLARTYGAPPRFAKAGGKPALDKGCFLWVDEAGKLQVAKGLVKRKAKADAEKDMKSTASADAKRERERAAADEHQRQIDAALHVVGRGLFGNPAAALAVLIASMAKEAFSLHKAPDGVIDVWGLNFRYDDDEDLLGLSSDVGWKGKRATWAARLAAKSDNLVAYIYDLEDAAREELLAFLVGALIDLQEHSPRQVAKGGRAQLAALGRLCATDPVAHATPATAELLASPLVQELTGRTAPAAPKLKPKSPAAKKAASKSAKVKEPA